MLTQTIEYAGLGEIPELKLLAEGRRHAYVPQPPRDLPLLTTRQAQIVGLLRNGVHRSKEIAFRMHWTEATTKLMLSMLYQRLRDKGFEVDNLASLAIFAFSPEVLNQRENESPFELTLGRRGKGASR